VEQLTYNELRNLVVYGGWHTEPIKRLGFPGASHLDGPAGFQCSNKFNAAVAFPSETILACTWNPDLAKELGVTAGKLAKIFKLQVWYAPAMNTHRSPIGGRCFEYYSEDPFLAGKMAAAEVQGAQSEKLLVTIKHYAINEEDKHRMHGHYWVSEQAAREIYLKPFEMAIKEGGAHGLMSAENCVGVKWAAEHEGLMTGILRDEWGFEGMAITDAAVLPVQRTDTGALAGSDLWLSAVSQKLFCHQLDKQYAKDPAGVTLSLQRAAKNILFAHAQTTLMK